MEAEDLINLSGPSNSGSGGMNDDTCEAGCGATEADSLPLISEAKDEIIVETPVTIFCGFHENMQTVVTTDIEKDAMKTMSSPTMRFALTESVSGVENRTLVGPAVHAENQSVAVQIESSLSSHRKSGTHLSRRELDTSCILLFKNPFSFMPYLISSPGTDRTEEVMAFRFSFPFPCILLYAPYYHVPVLCYPLLNLPAVSGVKRPRITDDEQQPSVHVIYSSLTNDSKRKLEELLLQWSQWHAQNYPSSNDSNVVLESGEETYFPALRIGLDEPSAVTFWVDNQIKNQSSKELMPLDGASVPLYDRGYSLALTSTDVSSSLDGGVESLDSSRCFNCGSYSHSLKDCRKPRDNVAVNNARKQHKSKRNQHLNSRNSTRYYKSSQGGKYDGLMPGILDAETRQILGLGELDPPPWLNRMRELGYPPGYLEPDEDNQPSGLTIFGEEVKKEETEDGEILDASYTKPSWKKSISFPGINAPPPENADERLWAASSSSSISLSRDRWLRRYNHSSEDLGRDRFHERRRSRDFEDDGPPGCEPGSSPSLSNHFLRHGDYDSSYSFTSQRSPSTPWSPTFGRSFSDRGRRGPLVHDGSPNNTHRGTVPYSSPR